MGEAEACARKWGAARVARAEDPRWREAIFRSLSASAFDAFGQIDPARAEAVLDRLTLPDGTEGLAELRKRLTSSDH